MRISNIKTRFFTMSVTFYNIIWSYVIHRHIVIRFNKLFIINRIINILYPKVLYIGMPCYVSSIPLRINNSIYYFCFCILAILCWRNGLYYIILYNVLHLDYFIFRLHRYIDLNYLIMVGYLVGLYCVSV